MKALFTSEAAPKKTALVPAPQKALVQASIFISTTTPIFMTIPISVPSDSSLNKTDGIKKKILKSLNIKKLYVQAINSLSNIEDILYIKDAFPSLLANKIVDILNITNKNIGEKNPRSI